MGWTPPAVFLSSASLLACAEGGLIFIVAAHLSWAAAPRVQNIITIIIIIGHNRNRDTLYWCCRRYRSNAVHGKHEHISWFFHEKEEQRCHKGRKEEMRKHWRIEKRTQLERQWGNKGENCEKSKETRGGNRQKRTVRKQRRKQQRKNEELVVETVGGKDERKCEKFIEKLKQLTEETEKEITKETVGAAKRKQRSKENSE